MANEVAMAKVRALEADAKIALMETKAQALRKSTDNAKEMIDSNMSKNTNIKWTNRLNIIGGIIRGMARPFGVIMKDLSPYLALVVVIMMMSGGFRLGGGGSRMNLGGMSAKRDKIFNKTGGILGSIRNWFERLFSKVAPGYRLRLLMRMLNPFAGYPNTVARARVGSGRCDDVIWNQSGNGVCDRTYEPKDIQWKMDTEKMPELSKAPTELRAIKTANGDKMTVHIPWALQDTFYVPQCSKAYFEVDGKKQSAGYLFEDTGMACKKRELASTLFNDKHRNKGAPLDTYATVAKP